MALEQKTMLMQKIKGGNFLEFVNAEVSRRIQAGCTLQ